ncbi:hypothetical protein ACO0LG_08055 [Undibacterium sp. Ji42W]|uniref:hypothetical protein n=1 Tax=Undibacterium sp. Ji42W TaxID=3413039 RepID=UPI003BF1E7A6
MNTAFLHVVKDPDLARDLSRIADDFDILGFFHHFGSSCFGMSAMLAQILTAKGYQAKVQGCYGEIRQGNDVFYLGYQGFAHQGQKEGHAVCLVEDKYLIDFGLGSLKKHYAADFKPALASPLHSNADGTGVIAHLPLGDGSDMVWRTDWISPMVETELLSQAATVQRVLAVFDDFQRNRVAHLVKKLFIDKDASPADHELLVMRHPHGEVINPLTPQQRVA